MMCKLKELMDKRWMDGCGNQRVDAKGGNLMCDFKGHMDKGGNYHVQMKRWMQKRAL